MARKKKEKTNKGNIYYVHPTHLVKPDEIGEYKKQKGNLNLRPVVVVEEKSKRKAQISRMTTTKPKSEDYEYKISHSGKYNNSYLDIRTQSKSKRSGKKFVIGEKPLDKSKGKLNEKDIKGHNKKRIEYYSKKKAGNKK